MFGGLRNISLIHKSTLFRIAHQSYVSICIEKEARLPPNRGQ